MQYVLADVSYEQLATIYTGLPEERQKISEFKQLSGDERRALVFKLFSDAKNKISKQELEGKRIKTVMHDLNVFSYQSKDVGEQRDHLFAKINRTSTVFGQVILAHILANPTADVQELQRRQKIVRLFVNNPDLFEQATALIDNIKRHQDALLVNYTEIDFVQWNDIKKEVFFNEFYHCNIFNTHAYSNQIFTSYVTSNILFLPSFLAGVCGSGYSLYSNGKKMNASNELKDWFLHYSSAGSAFVSLVANLVWCGYSLIHYKHNIQQVGKITPELCTRVQAVSQLVQNTHQLRRLLREHKTYIQSMRIFDDQFTQHIKNLSGADWYAGVRSFNAESAFGGQTRSTYYLMREHKHQLIELMKVIGELDAYLAIAKLYKEQQYSFVDFNTDNQAMQLQGFWNPMFSADKAVGNDMQLGGNNAPRGAIVTGSNTGGKSTIMINGLTAAIYLAQTLGIAPARSMSMKPFAYIGTLLKVQENINKGESHYQAEVKYAARVYKELKEVSENDEAYLAIDELFEGTVADVGSKALYAFVQKLLQNKRLKFVIVTQYRGDILNLEQESDGACQNYKVDVIKKQDGSVKRPREVKKGISQVSIGEKLFEEAFAEG